MAPRLFILGRERYGESTLLLCRLLAKVSPLQGRGEFERHTGCACLLLSSPSCTPLRISAVSKAAVQEPAGGCWAEEAVVVTRAPIMSVTTFIVWRNLADPSSICTNLQNQCNFLQRLRDAASKSAFTQAAAPIAWAAQSQICATSQLITGMLSAMCSPALGWSSALHLVYCWCC